MCVHSISGYTTPNMSCNSLQFHPQSVIASFPDGQPAARIRGALIKLWQPISFNNMRHLSVCWRLHLCCGRHQDAEDWRDGGNIYTKDFQSFRLVKLLPSHCLDVSAPLLCVWTYTRWRHWVCKGCLFLLISLISACHRRLSPTTSDMKQVYVLPGPRSSFFLTSNRFCLMAPDHKQRDSALNTIFKNVEKFCEHLCFFKKI